MPETWMYQAALICGRCAESVKEELKTAKGWTYRPADEEGDESWTFDGQTFNGDGDVLVGGRPINGTDTDTFPSNCAGLSTESDSVEFCDFGADCQEAFTPAHVPGGPAPWPIGVWLENDLTQYGLESLKAEIKARPRNPVVAFSRRQYAFDLSA